MRNLILKLYIYFRIACFGFWFFPSYSNNDPPESLLFFQSIFYSLLCERLCLALRGKYKRDQDMAPWETHNLSLQKEVCYILPWLLLLVSNLMLDYLINLIADNFIIEIQLIPY